jgi:putative transposase
MVWGVKYHKHLLNTEMKEFLVGRIKEICECYDFHFYCVGIAPNHVHFFAGAPPKVAPARIVQITKSITAREMFRKYPQLKKHLWGGELWKNGYYVGTISQGQTDAVVRKYIERQERQTDTKSYMKQLKLFF